ncbi:unnamed protein product [Lasius platythorax]|uniref:Metallo-beta-lactamase superfamily protein n=2 Tax=Lasius TaxID=488720 RepID=A0A0J7KWG8_LASNI|nr:metallo-beta-lactamase superfamily protein [Lasius niger]
MLVPLVRSIVLRGDHLSFRVPCLFSFPCTALTNGGDLSEVLWVRKATLLPKYLSQRIVLRGGGIYMALDIGREKGGILESLSFLGLPHQTNGEREDPRVMEGGMFPCDAAEILFLCNRRLVV